MQTAFHRLAVIGSGTMGLGIVEFLAGSGFHVQFVDTSREIVDKAIQRLQRKLQVKVEKGRLTLEIKEALLNRIHAVNDIKEITDVHVVIEAVVEKLDVKGYIFQQLDEMLEEDVILATNTSSLSVTSIASFTKNPERVLGLHFFNPAPKMPLVEIIQGIKTDRDNVHLIMEWIRKLGKEPVKVMDSPGFLVNRIARPFHLEAYRLVGNNIASKEQVDAIIRDAGFKMGPFELQDFIGIDINYAASKSVYDGFFQENRFRPHPHQKLMVESGSLGQKTKRGHFPYE